MVEITQGMIMENITKDMGITEEITKDMTMERK